MLLRDMLDRYANLQRQRQQESDAIESGEHGSYELYDELEDNIAELFIDNAPALTALLARLDALTAYDTATEAGDNDDSHDEAIRVAAREVMEQTRGAGGEHSEPDYADLRQAHTAALRAVDGDSNDDEIAAWRETAELATAYLPGYQDPTID
ncbi:hypothetical protein M3G04_04795 [Dietzia cinnamea]|uniref:hypothetical protein n=1 Tax=Dietzia cinnamea TaxID=321318 RepID=UPI00223A81BA|nr:hypothetical protein [Dietzia cinnamea]MCT2300222.1 hypothetical protein [Dietzia cinnamea]